MQGSTPLPKKWWQKIKPDCLTAKKKTTRRGNFLESSPVNTQQAGVRL